MTKMRKLLSLLVAMAIAASAFVNLSVVSYADDDDPASPVWLAGRDNSAAGEFTVGTYEGKENAMHVEKKNVYTVMNDVDEGTVNFNTNVYITAGAAIRSFRIVFQSEAQELYNTSTAFAQVAVDAGDGSIYVGPALADNGSGTVLFKPTAAGWYNIDATVDYSKKDTNEFITVVASDSTGAELGTQKIGSISGVDTILKAIRLVSTASDVYFADMKVTPGSALAPAPEETEAPEPEPEETEDPNEEPTPKPTLAPGDKEETYFEDDLNSYDSTGLSNQGKEDQSKTLGKMTVAVGSRGGGGDNASVIAMEKDGENSYFKIVSGGYATSQRGASIAFAEDAGIPAFSATEDGYLWQLSFDAKYTDAASTIQIMGVTDNTTTTGGQVVNDPYLSVANNSQIVTGEWLHVAVNVAK
ncbi:MAG: hypothetical protein J1F64_03910, partial [Oscillospiraceae bacterium]|nr:hypothetical protein [Oscillospiraceae bacterium]